MREAPTQRADGFHELELVSTVLEGVAELTDTLEGEPASELSLTITGPTGDGLVADESNLVIKAWRLLEDAAKRPLPAALRLHKRIPHGAGLGGGSSDAAAALRLGNQLFELGLEDGFLLRQAARLGSDVPLFLLGGTVLGLGRGERVFPLRPVPLEPILLVHPGLYVGTPTGDTLRMRSSTRAAFSSTAHGHQVTRMPILHPHTRTRARAAAHAAAFPGGTHARA